MTRLTTALLVAGPRSVGPWDDRIWRIALHASLVEGGSAAYWSVTPSLPALHDAKPGEVVIEYPDTECIVDTTLMMLATYLGGEQVEALLVDTHNITLDDETRKIANCWELLPDTRTQLAKVLASSLRLGVTELDELTLLNTQAVEGLREFGFDVDVFALRPRELNTPV